MKTKMILFTVTALFLMIGGMGCEREKEHEVIVPDKNISTHVYAFFENNLPTTSKSVCFFISEEGDFSYVINSKKELQAAYSCKEELPEIDFDRYSLVIGQKRMPNSYYAVSNQKIIVQTKTLELNIVAETLSEGVWPSFSMMYYWGVYPKLPNLKLNVNIEIK